jgi:hypothetical protein
MSKGKDTHARKRFHATFGAAWPPKPSTVSDRNWSITLNHIQGKSLEDLSAQYHNEDTGQPLTRERVRQIVNMAVEWAVRDQNYRERKDSN